MAAERTARIYLEALDRNGERALLNLSTSKSASGLLSVASVTFRRPDGIVTFELWGDFRKTVKVDRNARATQKNIDTQHFGTFTDAYIAELQAEALAFYASKATA
jgi:hypothetical protein